MKINELFKEQVITVDFGKKTTKPEKQYLSMMDAFGTSTEKQIDALGVKFVEKPSYWEELNEKTISELDVKRIEKALGYKLSIYSGKDLYGFKPKGPLVSFKIKPKDDIAVIEFEDSTKYLVNFLHANTYIRMWKKIEN